MMTAPNPASAIAGVGTDICEISRVEEALLAHGERFLRRLLTEAERGQKEWTPAALARRWALKEAVAKACRTGIGGALGFQDIDITYTEAGALTVRVAIEGLGVHASVSDDGNYAIAFAVAERSGL